uniref:Solute carrier family 40 protein n=1 Tax=Syphacia muris TaxID=451379 RepID=A0A0N5AQJ3_9BILA
MVSARTGKLQVIPTVCVLIQELMRMAASLLLLCFQEHSARQGLQLLHEEFVKKWKDALKVCIPAFIYVVQNNLMFLAARNLEAPVYLDQQETSKKASAKHQLLNETVFHGNRRSQYFRRKIFVRSSISNVAEKDILVGTIAILLVVSLSGCSGIFWEKLLKNKADISIWLKNAEISIISIPILLLLIAAKDSSTVMSRGFMAGLDVSAWINMLITSLGGLLIGFAITFADSILKAFANSIAIIIVCLLSIMLFDFLPSLKFLLGTFLFHSNITTVNVYQYGIHSIDDDSAGTNRSVTESFWLISLPELLQCG